MTKKKPLREPASYLYPEGQFVRNLKTQRRAVARRRIGALALMGALGVTEQKGRGRPSGTYKYGMPIQEYKKQQSLKRAQYSKYKQDQMRELSRRGLTPEAVREIQYRRAIEEGVVMPQSSFEETPEQTMAVADDELEFRRFAADKTISPNTKNMLLRLRRIQLKGKRDDVEMQRRLKERRMVASAGNLLKTPFIFKDNTLDITGVSSDNILMAPNVFKETPENFILRTKKLNILQTRESGNDLRF